MEQVEPHGEVEQKFRPKKFEKWVKKYLKDGESYTIPQAGVVIRRREIAGPRDINVWREYYSPASKGEGYSSDAKIGFYADASAENLHFQIESKSVDNKGKTVRQQITVSGAAEGFNGKFKNSIDYIRQEGQARLEGAWEVVETASGDSEQVRSGSYMPECGVGGASISDAGFRQESQLIDEMDKAYGNYTEAKSSGGSTQISFNTYKDRKSVERAVIQGGSGQLIGFLREAVLPQLLTAPDTSDLSMDEKWKHIDLTKDLPVLVAKIWTPSLTPEEY